MINDIYKKWECGKADDSDYKEDFSELPEFLDKLYKEFKIDIEKAVKPFDAYFSILKLNNFFNSILKRRPDLIGKMVKLFQREKKDLEIICKKIGAIYFDFSYGFPGGISISLTFQPNL